MRAVTEGLRLVVDAGRLWWHQLLPLVTVYLFGYALHLLGLWLSVWIGSRQPAVATVVFVLAVLVRVASLVVMLWLCRPADDHERALDVVATAIGPFLAVYALWGLVDDEVHDLFAANVAVSGIGGVEAYSLNLQWLTLYVGLAVGAWVLRQLVGAITRRRPRRPLLLLGAALEGVWTFASALALLAGLGRVLEWLTSRAVWQGALTGWYGFLALLPDVRLPFDLTLPEAVAGFVGWLVDTLVPTVWSALVLPLVWLALAAVVFGWRRLDARTLVSGTALHVADLDHPGRTRATRAGRLLHSAWLLLTADLRTKYLPVLQALRLLWTTGVWFLTAYLVLATALTTARTWAILGLAHRLGPRDPYLALTWDWLDSLVVDLPYTTAAVALYAAATRRALTRGVSRDAAPTGGYPSRRTTVP